MFRFESLLSRYFGIFMKVGLINIEPKIFNPAYMKISTYHKAKGHEVSWYSPLFDKDYDRIYCSSLFSFTDKSQIPKRAICGGTGFYPNVNVLPPEIESCSLDYSLYPKLDYSMIWFTKGCIRKCSFCLVNKCYKTITEQEWGKYIVENPKFTHIKIMDDNFFASPYWKDHLSYLQVLGQPVDFQGVDVRLLNEQMCRGLLTLKHHKRIKIAWDNPSDDIIPKIKFMLNYIKAYKIMCYVLIGYNSTYAEDLDRVLTIQSLGVSPFVMQYDRHNRYQKDFARWVNMKATFKKCTFSEYLLGKGKKNVRIK
jgi:hypothetical protein